MNGPFLNRVFIAETHPLSSEFKSDPLIVDEWTTTEPSARYVVNSMLGFFLFLRDIGLVA